MLFEPDVPRRQLSGHLVWFLTWVFTVAMGLILRPHSRGHGTHEQLGLPPCPSVLLFGRPCPGCGLTTSWTLTIQGRIGEAFGSHALGPILFLGFTVSAFLCLYGFVKGKRLRSETKGVNWFLGAVALVFFAYGFARFWMVQEFDSRFRTVPIGVMR